MADPRHMTARALSRSLGALALVACLGLTVAAGPADAGIMDSITGFFGKASDTVKGWFSGGGEKEFVKLLEQTAQSQQALADKQTNLQALYNQRGAGGVKPNDAIINERLNDIAQASRQNEALYLSMLKARDELTKGKKDITKYQEALGQITERQNQIETQYQEIQKFNKETGGFTPPAQIAAGGAKASLTASSGQPDWKDPTVQGYIDEWLKACALTDWGVYLAPGARAAGPPDHGGKLRHQYIWENMWTKDAGSSISLGDYVKLRMAGKTPSVTLANRPQTFVASGNAVSSPPASFQPEPSTPAPAPAPAQVAAQLEGSTGTTSSSGGGQPTGELRDVIDQEKSVLNSIAKLNTDGQGNSEAARKLYESLKAIQTRKNELIKNSSGSITTPR